MTQENVIKSRKSSPDTRSWYEFFWREKQETPKRIEDAAKFLATMISISLTLFLTMGETASKNVQCDLLPRLSLLCWLVALLISFFVLFPCRYSYVSESVKSMKEAHQRMIRNKYVLLTISLILFMTALLIATYLFLF